MKKVLLKTDAGNVIVKCPRTMMKKNVIGLACDILKMEKGVLSSADQVDVEYITASNSKYKRESKIEDHIVINDSGNVVTRYFAY